MNKNKTFRLENIAAARLESMSKDLHISQTSLLEELISACFDERCENFKVKENLPNNKGFDRLTASLNYRLTLAGEK